MTAGTKVQVFVAVNGLAAHALTGRPQVPLLEFDLQSADGERTMLDEVRILRQGASSDGAEFGVLVEITLPPLAQGGVRWLKATATDAPGGTRASGQLELWVASSR